MSEILLELKNKKRVFLPGKQSWMISALRLPGENLSLFLDPQGAVKLPHCGSLQDWNRQTAEVCGSMVRM